jgi:hypothetical protein
MYTQPCLDLQPPYVFGVVINSLDSEFRILVIVVSLKCWEGNIDDIDTFSPCPVVLLFGNSKTSSEITNYERYLSTVPWLGAVRVAYINNKYIVIGRHERQD